MSREFLEDFIKIYESEPCLWQVKSKIYHDRVKKEAAYARLIEKFKTIEPTTACKFSVLKKINNIRSAYRKERKKVKASQESGAGTEEVYEPKLWYFKLLRFLDDQDTPQSSRSNIGSDEDDDVTSNNEENGEEDLSQDNTDDAMWIENVREATAGQRVSPVTPQGHPPNKKRLRETQEQSFTDEVPRTVKEEFNTPRVAEDRFDVFGKLVAMKLRSLPKEEMLLAEKYISDTLFHAEMGDLNGVDNVSVQYDSN
ncbi:hypothetical protein MTP99_008495 [Tenebrio molitor]|nr:hypothetical protein MTP99_008495 [Tenebrio molitor]